MKGMRGGMVVGVAGVVGAVDVVGMIDLVIALP